jgi:hypothetical protein
LTEYLPSDTLKLLKKRKNLAFLVKEPDVEKSPKLVDWEELNA